MLPTVVVRRSNCPILHPITLLGASIHLKLPIDPFKTYVARIYWTAPVYT